MSDDSQQVLVPAPSTGRLVERSGIERHVGGMIGIAVSSAGIPAEIPVTFDCPFTNAHSQCAWPRCKSGGAEEREHCIKAVAAVVAQVATRVVPIPIDDRYEGGDRRAAEERRRVDQEHQEHQDYMARRRDRFRI